MTLSHKKRSVLRCHHLFSYLNPSGEKSVTCLQNCGAEYLSSQCLKVHSVFVGVFVMFDCSFWGSI